MPIGLVGALTGEAFFLRAPVQLLAGEEPRRDGAEVAHAYRAIAHVDVADRQAARAAGRVGPDTCAP